MEADEVVAGQWPEDAGRHLDAVGCAKIASYRGLAGPVLAPSSYFLLQSADSFHVHGDKLTLSNGDTVLIRYSEASVEQLSG